MKIGNWTSAGYIMINRKLYRMWTLAGTRGVMVLITQDREDSTTAILAAHEKGHQK